MRESFVKLNDRDDDATRSSDDDGDATRSSDDGEDEIERRRRCRSRLLRKSRDFDFSLETLLMQSKEEDDKSSYTALLLKDIKNFHGEGRVVDDEEEDLSSLLRLVLQKLAPLLKQSSILTPPASV
ncbi:hypothetical protein Bca52824_023169 [Brassica carinata]|uniref:Uncharacterized protein n=1 Tax=Brassica carinata TaxID=52824 RepID=A0A8X7VI28_BRACI|nr:hypothetical protein Bca52824_023169 [Brassica carinata]